MRLKLILICLLFIIKINGQNDPNKSKLPEYAPVSPEAYKLGTYGNVPVNLSTGKINYKVPFYTIKVNNYELPIFMNYNYSGLLVNESASEVGIGWSLNAGGVLIKERRGKDDFGVNGFQSNYYSTSNKVGKDYIIPIYFNDYQNTSDKNLVKYRILNNIIDGMPDKFSFNANNINGAFYFNEEAETVFTPFKNFKVERIEFTDFVPPSLENRKERYILTDDTGNKYYFGYDFIGETTPDAFSETDENQYNPYNSTYYLYKIEFPNSSETITFEYEPFHSQKTINNQTITKLVTSTIPPQTLPDTQAMLNNPSTPNSGNRHTGLTVIDTYLLKKIIFPSGEITFNRDVNAISNDLKKRIIDIKVTDLSNNDNEILNYNFLYKEDHNLFLDKITKVTDNTELNYYSFNYKNLLGIPSDIIREGDNLFNVNNSKLQKDFYGFYNNRTLNPTSILTTFNGLDHLIPSFDKTSLGAITKINYPTGGFTSIEYENNTVIRDERSSLFDKADRCNDFFDSNNFQSVHLDYSSSTDNLSSDIDLSNEVNTIYAKFNVKFDVDLSRGQGQSQFLGSLTFKKKISNTNNIYINNIGINDIDNAQFCSPLNGVDTTFDFDITIELANVDPTTYANDQKTFYVKIPPELYEISLFIESGQLLGDVNNHDEMLIEMSTISNEEYLQAIESFENHPVEVGGIRVMKTLDCNTSIDLIENKCIEKEYKYILDNENTSGILLKEPIYERVYPYYIVHQFIVGGAHLIADVFLFKDYYSSNRNPYSNFDGNHLLYKRVEILSKNNLLGKEVKFFTGNFLGESEFPHSPKKDENYKIGRQYETQYNNSSYVDLIKESTIYEDKKLSNYTFNNTTLGRVIGINSGTYTPGNFVFYMEGINNNNQYWNTYFESNNFINDNAIAGSEQAFIDIPYDYLPIETHKIEYYDTDEVATTTNYVYDDETGYLKTKETTTNNNEKQKVELTYPYEKTDAISQAMTTKNMISSPIETESYRIEDGGNQQLLSTQKTIYQEFGVNNLLLPSIVQTAKGEITANNLLEDRITYHSYDQYGNPTELSKVDGVHIVYIWGYNHTQPIAKIINATYSEVETILGANFVISDYFTSTQENNLRNGLSDAQVTTMEYLPLIGVSKITDSTRNEQTFHYDEFNRLQFVKDAQGNILSKNEYHYRN